jgi:hypothetical protein
MDQTLMKRQGNAAVELLLLLPLFALILAFGGIIGSYSRLASLESSIVDITLNLPDNSDYDTMINTLARDSGLGTGEIAWHLKQQHDDSEVKLEITDISSETNGMSVENATQQEGAYVEDHIGLKEEVTRMFYANTSLGFTDDQKQATETSVNLTPASRWFDAYGDKDELSSLLDFLDKRSLHRSSLLAIEDSPKLLSLLSDNPLGANFQKAGHRRVRNPDFPGDWLEFDPDEAEDYHNYLESFLMDQGETGATLQNTPYWDIYKEFHRPN